MVTVRILLKGMVVTSLQGHKNQPQIEPSSHHRNQQHYDSVYINKKLGNLYGMGEDDHEFVVQMQRKDCTWTL